MLPFLLGHPVYLSKVLIFHIYYSNVLILFPTWAYSLFHSRFIQLEGCRHVFEVSALDRHMGLGFAPENNTKISVRDFVFLCKLNQHLYNNNDFDTITMSLRYLLWTDTWPGLGFAPENNTKIWVRDFVLCKLNQHLYNNNHVDHKTTLSID